MKILFCVLMILTISKSQAGILYNHLVYVCSNSSGMELHVLNPRDDIQRLEGSMMVLDRSANGAPEFGYWCSSKLKGSKNKIVLSEKEYIAEDPTSCRFTLNKKTLTARAGYKKWTGYIGGFGKPDVKTDEKLDCIEKDEIVNY